jgi:5-formyltetrahydrofolate cyclo-ligase
MSHELPLQKRELRRQLLAFLKALTEAEIAEQSARACLLLREQPIWKKARSVLFYASLAREIDLTPILDEGLRAGKTIALPRFIAESGVYEAVQIRDTLADCAPGKFGISEPLSRCQRYPLKQLDLILTPGVGFDVTGHRLGRGLGFYDRLLAEMSGIKCGVAFDQQIVEGIPAEKHDVRMNYILTPTRCMEISD